jgi:hypothetical protein
LNPWHYGPPELNYVAATGKELKETVRQKEHVYNELWNMFYDHYLIELRQMATEPKQPTSHLLKENLIVLFRPIGWKLTNKAGERRKWRLAKIIKLHKGRDGEIRAVDLLIYDKKSESTKVLPSQSIRNIAILEADLTADSIDIPPINE